MAGQHHEALAALLRPGNAGSNTATDHLTVVEAALTQLPDRWRSKPILIRADGAGYSHALISALSQQGLEFSVGYPVTQAVRDAIAVVPKWAWTTASNADGLLREHADVVDVTKMLDLSKWTKTCPGRGAGGGCTRAAILAELCAGLNRWLEALERPAVGQGAVEPFDLAVGLPAAGPGALVDDTELGAGVTPPPTKSPLWRSTRLLVTTAALMVRRRGRRSGSVERGLGDVGGTGTSRVPR